MDDFRYKVITDPVHGSIGLSKIEARVIDTPTFQRLRRLKQLGLAHLVYPSAGHSRFAHSLGVFHVMGRAIDTLIHKGHLQETEKQKLRLAGLLHDVGHYPYSHLTEKLDTDPLRPRWLKKVPSKDPRRDRYPDHETLGRLIVTQRDDIRTALEPDFGAEEIVEIADIFCGQHHRPIYNGLVHSSLDLDRMDYLVRDAIATGVPLGRIDLEYLLSHLNADREGMLGLERKAATAAEHFMLARYFMSKVVYLHKTVFAFESLMRQILFLLREEGKLWMDGAAVKNAVRNDEEFSRFHDGHIDELIDAQAGRPDSVGWLCRALRLRHPPVLLEEFRVLRRRDDNAPEEMTRFRTRLSDQLPELAKAVGIPIECFLWENPKDVSLERVGPFVGITAAQTAEETDELLRVVREDGTSEPLIADPDSLVHHLSEFRLHTTRLYVVERDEAKLAAVRARVREWSA
ncbi:MAG TPA: HD domain-containing protein [Candidatus Polarisedimenticolaceae bacterium]|nr:HD domain-containing protein [Candidatus Polarisedimenticolaceae bacterium]